MHFPKLLHLEAKVPHQAQKATGIENRSQISNFWLYVKIGEEWAKSFSQFYQFSLDPNRRYTFDGATLGSLGSLGLLSKKF